MLLASLAAPTDGAFQVSGLDLTGCRGAVLLLDGVPDGATLSLTLTAADGSLTVVGLEATATPPPPAPPVLVSSWAGAL